MFLFTSYFNILLNVNKQNQFKLRSPFYRVTATLKRKRIGQTRHLIEIDWFDTSLRQISVATKEDISLYLLLFLYYRAII